jgi:hypothetical protein
MLGASGPSRERSGATVGNAFGIVITIIVLWWIIKTE